MLDEIISYHYIMVEVLLFVVTANMILPLWLKKNIEKMVFWSRIGYFAFWMFWSMNIFAGLIVFMFTGRALTLSVSVMILVSVLLGMVETYRVVRSKKIWVQGLDALRFSTLMLLIEMLLIVAVSILALGSA